MLRLTSPTRPSSRRKPSIPHICLQQHLAALLSRWNPEKIKFGPNLGTPVPFLPPGEGVIAPVALEKLHTLSIDGDDLLHFLQQHSTPELWTIETRLDTPHLTIDPDPTDGETLWNHVREMSIEYNLFFSYKPDIKAFLILFPNIHSLSITLTRMVDVSQDVDSLLQPLESGVFAIKQLHELAVSVDWNSLSREDMFWWRQSKRFFEAGIRYSLSLVVQRRSGWDFPPLKARLFVKDHTEFPGRTENKLIWSSGLTSPDDELRESWRHYCSVREEPVDEAISDIASSSD